jgi:hypothetical protein
MALPAFASIEEFSTWEPVAVSNTERAEAILAAASTLIRAHTGRVWVDETGPQADATEVQLATVKNICLTVTSRVYNNPNGLTDETAGPYSRRVADWAALGLALTDEEAAQLAVTPTGGSVPGLWSLKVAAPRSATGTPYFTAEWWEDSDSEFGEGDEDEGS